MTFASALSGLNTSSQAIDVIGRNLELTSTPGSKSSQINFKDIYTASLSSAMPAQSQGLGATVGSTVQLFTQGSISTTSNPLDMAINGQGFFRMNNNGSIIYTRNGQFHLALDPADRGKTLSAAELTKQKMILINDEAFRVTGYLADPSGAIPKAAAPQDIAIDTNMQALATSKVSLGVNLDPRMPSLSLPFDPADIKTYSSATSTKTYDAKGYIHDLTMYFVKTEPSTWQAYTSSSTDLYSLPYPVTVTTGTNDQFSIQLDGGAKTTATLPSGQYISAAALKTGFQAAVDTALGADKALVSFDAGNHLVISSAQPGARSMATLSEGNGALASYFSVTNVTNPAGSLKFDASGKPDGTSTQVFTVDQGAGAPPITLDLSGSTQYGTAFGVNSISRDGFGAGQLLGLEVGADGVLAASYSNGQTRTAGQIVLAGFTNLNGLIKMGNSQWAESAQSGAARLDTPANPDPKSTLDLGPIKGGAIEESNVNQGEELLALITQQRAYQANAQSIKAQDQLLQTLVGIR